MIYEYLDKIPRQITRIYLDTLLKSNFLTSIEPLNIELLNIDRN